MSLDSQLQSVFTSIGTAVKGKVSASEKGVANGIATLGADGKVPSAQLPSFVDDVLEFANLALFPATGETGKIYIALDTNITYRWSGSVYVSIDSGSVTSVNSKTGVVTLVKADIGLANADNTSDANKPVSTAQQTALDAKANLSSPSFTGTPSLPTGTTAITQIAGNNTTSIATTAFVTGAVGIVTTSIGATDTNYVAVFNAALV